MIIFLRVGISTDDEFGSDMSKDETVVGLDNEDVVGGLGEVIPSFPISLPVWLMKPAPTLVMLIPMEFRLGIGCNVPQFPPILALCQLLEDLNEPLLTSLFHDPNRPKRAICQVFDDSVSTPWVLGLVRIG
jgi:hypothetical protein